jgi:hypothetical protein
MASTAKDSDGTADGESQGAAADEDSFEMVSGWVEQTV